MRYDRTTPSRRMLEIMYKANIAGQSVRALAEESGFNYRLLAKKLFELKKRRSKI